MQISALRWRILCSTVADGGKLSLLLVDSAVLGSWQVLFSGRTEVRHVVLPFFRWSSSSWFSLLRIASLAQYCYTGIVLDDFTPLGREVLALSLHVIRLALQAMIHLKRSSQSTIKTTRAFPRSQCTQVRLLLSLIDMRLTCDA